MSTLRTMVASLAIPLVFSACAPATTTTRSMEAPTPDGATTVKVRNNNWMDVVVYAVRDGSRFRLGLVRTHNSTVLRLPHGMLAGASDVRLLLDPVGSSRTFLTDAIPVWDGEQIRLDVENYLPLTSFAVFR